MMTEALYERHPYLNAERAFMLGDMHTITAIGLVSRDREWIAECDIKGIDPDEAARVLVRHVWAARKCGVAPDQVPTVATIMAMGT